MKPRPASTCTAWLSGSSLSPAVASLRASATLPIAASRSAAFSHQNRSGFFAVGSNGRVHGALRHLARFADAACVGLAVRIEREPEVLNRAIFREPPLLSCYGA